MKTTYINGFIGALILALVMVWPSWVGATFINNDDGTVSDTITELMWQESDDGTDRNWEAALSYCENLIFPSHGGYADWRLPNRRELDSIVDVTRYAPATDPVFACRSSSYWSSSSGVAQPDGAWSVNFSSGHVFNDSKTEDYYYVRCVRGKPGSFEDLTLFFQPDGNCGGKEPCLDRLQAGLDRMAQGRVIMKIGQDVYTEDLVAAEAGDYWLLGGYDAGFVQQIGVSTIAGSLSVSAGTIRVENLIIKGP